ncbi:MerR family transcriptional regulator [Micromonospora halophytica]|uniref:DNA polymerase III subunit beta family protein n=1 Tax=Micromonospora halophytica TaxID=47864 RepID=UPI000B87C557|nr:MerR family transcriptional regulator [Micromonospora halophytica]
MRSIGELARASGLTVSALRFYDRTGVLAPALVDPVTGYRWYTDEQVIPARLVAGLRRVGLPLTEIGVALRHRHEPAVVGRLLDAHLRRLEDGLADARRELSRVRALLAPEENLMTTRLFLSRADLAAAVDAVRFAVGADPDLPVLAGVLLDVEPDGLRLVATDRHRLAVARAAGRVDGPPVRALLPVDAVDELRTLLDTGEGATPEVGVMLTDGRVTASVAGREVTATALPYDFPDYRRLLRRTADDGPTRRVPVDAAALRDDTAPTVTREHDGVPLAVTVLGVRDADGLRLVGADEPAGDDPDELRVGVNGGYLLDALDAAGAPQLVLELDGPIAPLAIRRPDDADAFSILMPIRL